MSLKIAVAVLAVVCAVQAFSIDQDAVQDFQARGISASDILDKIKESLEKIREHIKELETNLKDAIETAYEKVQAVAQNAATKWKDAVEKAIEKANAASVSVQECVKDKEVLDQIVNTILAESRQCVADEREKLQEVQVRVQEVAQKVDKIFKEAIEASKTCGSKPLLQQPGCVFGEMAPFVSQVAGMAGEISTVAFEVSRATATAVKNIGTCVQTSVKTNGAEAQKVADTMVKCIRDKVNANKPL